MEKEKALEAALLHIEKQFGKGSVMKFGPACQDSDPRDSNRLPFPGHGPGCRKRRSIIINSW